MMQGQKKSPECVLHMLYGMPFCSKMEGQNLVHCFGLIPLFNTRVKPDLAPLAYLKHFRNRSFVLYFAFVRVKDFKGYSYSSYISHAMFSSVRLTFSLFLNHPVIENFVRANFVLSASSNTFAFNAIFKIKFSAVLKSGLRSPRIGNIPLKREIIL